MPALTRKPLQGLINIIRFNWHFYVLALMVIVLTLQLCHYVPAVATFPLLIIAYLTALSTAVSLIVSCYVYDGSTLYTLHWLPPHNPQAPARIINIHAGFDETSALVAGRYPTASLRVIDFYDPARHTEISIRRARKTYPPYPGTETAGTTTLPLSEKSADLILGLLAFHEIRARHERIAFLKQLRKALSAQGTLILAEHLRDIPNAIAYNLGCFHFFSAREWKANFAAAGLSLKQETTVTPFITIFTLTRNHGDTP